MRVSRGVELGRRGEDVALSYLRGLGMELLARNWRHGRTEIDLIMVERSGEWGEPILRVVEVKSLAAPCSIDPVQSVDLKKQQAIIKTAAGFIGKHGVKWETLFDVVSVIFGPGDDVEIKYYPQAFSPQW